MLKRLPDGEFEVMKVIWNTTAPVTTLQIMEKLKGKNWKPQTVLTMLVRLIEKGFLRSERQGRERNYTPIDLYVCGFVSSSMLTGFLRPVILLPEKHFETDELEFIFRHELIHYKRRDLVIKFLSVIAVSLHWFNPFV